ncbi:keratin-associated protein 13-1-like [Mustela nigripes]|uniref:keratin-associated protein 13-1-like n=1 Tax=Mustela nigripes TaxID=77151 RepID=UPI0028159F2C|nr:keratin-associated protein 13-1-like [Mustela nigripes]
MSYSCCSGTFSSRSLGGYLRYPGSSCGSYPSNLVYRTDLCSPSTCQLGSSLSSGCQETCYEPTRCQTSCMVSRPCQTFCYRPRTSSLCSPCWTAYPGSVGIGSSSYRSLGYGSRSCYSLGFRPLGFRICGFPSLGYGSRFCHPTYFTSRSYQSLCYRPLCGSGFYRATF